jgi:hypothetical protein
MGLLRAYTIYYTSIRACLYGPIGIVWSGVTKKNRYTFIKINDFIRKLWILFLKNKDNALDNFKIWIAIIKIKYENRIIYLRTDRRGEFISDVLIYKYLKRSIVIKYSVPYTSKYRVL